MFRRISFVITLFASLISYHFASAEQLVIEEPRFKQGFAFTVTVDNREACIKGARNFSNLFKTTDFVRLKSNDFYKITFSCFTSKGDITDHGIIYQIPFSLNNKMCLHISKWVGFAVDDKKCPNGLFVTEPVMVRDLSLDDYISIKH